MKRTYTTPVLVTKGAVVEITRSLIVGGGDRKSPELEFEAMGSVGFQL